MMLNKPNALVVFDGLDEGEIGGFGGAEGVARGGGVVVGVVAEADAEGDGFGFGGERFGRIEGDEIVFFF